MNAMMNRASFILVPNESEEKRRARLQPCVYCTKANLKGCPTCIRK